MGSDALAPAFVHNVFDPLEIGSAQRCDAVIRAIDDFGETRQFDLLGLGKQIWIKLLKQPIAWTRLFYRCGREASHTLIAARGTLDPLRVFLLEQSHLARMVYK